MSMACSQLLQPEVGVNTHRSVASSHESVVHVEKSSQREPPLPMQTPLPSHESIDVQNMPSSQNVPGGANGFEQVPEGVQTSLVHRLVSMHLAHVPPLTPHADGSNPAMHVNPFQQPAQQRAP